MKKVRVVGYALSVDQRERTEGRVTRDLKFCVQNLLPLVPLEGRPEGLGGGSVRVGREKVLTKDTGEKVTHTRYDEPGRKKRPVKHHVTT